MSGLRELCALPLTGERFAPFGDVIEARSDRRQAMNSSRFDRFADLAEIDTQDGAPCVSIARCRTATRLPYCVDMLERHPDGSQAFVPLGGFAFVVAVAPAAESFEPEDIVAFISNGRQGVNYRRGVWHMPMIALQDGQEFLVIDRAGAGCDESYLDQPVLLGV